MSASILLGLLAKCRRRVQRKSHMLALISSLNNSDALDNFYENKVDRCLRKSRRKALEVQHAIRDSNPQISTTSQAEVKLKSMLLEGIKNPRWEENHRQFLEELDRVLVAA